MTDILSELERQIGPLEKQAEAARKYLSLRERQHRLDANFFLSEEARISRELSQIEEKLSVSTQELEQRKKEYEDIRREYDHLEADIRQLDLSLGELREKAQKSALTRQQQTGRIDVLKEQILAQIHSLEIRAARLDAIGTELSSRQGEESELQKEKNLLQTQIRKLQEELSLQEEQLDEVHNDEAACEKAITEGKDEVFSLLEERSNTKGKLQRFEALMEQINIRKAQISQRLIQGKSDEVQIGQQAQKAQEDILRIQGDISELANRQTEAEKSLEELTATIHGQNDQLQIGQAAFHRESARLESLQNMAERYDGYGSSIRRVMEQKAKVPGLLGVVADLIQTDKKYELAIETALGGSIQHIVTDQVDVARQMIDYLKKNRLGRATFLPLESLSEKKEFRPVQALSEKGVLGTADTLVQTQDRFRILAESLLGRILVVDTMDNAVLIARKYHYSLRLVTLEGDSFSPGGSMTGGAYKNNSNLLGRRREIEELKASIQALEKDLNEMAETIEKNREKRNLVRDSLTQLASDLAEKQVELNTATLLLESQREKMTQIQDEYRAIAHSQEELKEDESRIRQERREVNDQLNASARDEGEINDFLEEKQKELDELRLKEQALNTQAEQTRLSFSTSSQKAEYIQASLNRLAQEQKALLAEQEEIQRSLGQVERERQEKEEEIQGLQESIGMLMTQEEEARREILLQEKIKEEKSAVHKGLFSRSDETSGQISLLDKECYRLKSQAERLEERKETQISYLWDEYQMTPHEAEEFRMDPVPDVKEMQKELGSIRELAEILHTPLILTFALDEEFALAVDKDAANEVALI
ncbi:MAG: hypothetical protein IKL39_00220, partial [Mailhella sp.]|nr:hypothetical protein [Mailhella sp.]